MEYPSDFVDQVILGDCLDVMPAIPSKSVDTIICDLPYGSTQNKWDIIIPFAPLWKQYLRVIKPNGAIVLFGSEPFTSLLISSQIKLFRYKWTWVKGNKPTGFLNAKKQPLRITEDVVVFYKKQCVYHPQMTVGEACHSRGKAAGTAAGRSQNYGEYHAVETEGNLKYPQDILFYPRDKVKLHPTQKPVALVEYLIRTYSDEGSVILDNCMGSGTTGVACQNTARHYIGIEKSAHYWDVATRRIRESAAQPA